MSISTLYKSGALSSGAKLWVLPGISKTNWGPKIDWYLNLQVSKAKQLKPQKLSDEILPYLYENNLTAPKIEMDENPPVLISSSELLPCEYLIDIEFGSSADTWVQNIYKVWQQLKRPSLRVFLPESMTDDEFTKFWSKLSSLEDEITLVPSTSASEG